MEEEDTAVMSVSLGRPRAANRRETWKMEHKASELPEGSREQGTRSQFAKGDGEEVKARDKILNKRR